MVLRSMTFLGMNELWNDLKSRDSGTEWDARIKGDRVNGYLMVIMKYLVIVS